MNTHTPNHDAVLAAIFDPQLTPADLPAKTGLSLPQLARWIKANAQAVDEVREFLTVRATLIGARLHTASLAALDRVVRECPDLERVRKAASTILRSLKSPAARPPSPRDGGEKSPSEARGTRGTSQRVGSGATTPTADRAPKPPRAAMASIDRAPLSRPSLADRLAAIRLAKLQTTRPLAAS